MSTPSTPAPKKRSPESLEQRQKDRAAEEEISGLSAEERKKRQEEQRLKYEKEKAEIKKSLYGDLATEKPAASSDQKPERPEESKKPKSNEQKEKEDRENFKKLFDAAVENIKSKKAFRFEGIDADNLGRPASHLATMTALLDHSQKGEKKPEDIWKRVENKQAKLGQIGLQVEIDMGEQKNSNLGLTNLKMEISLESLMNGGFIEKMTRFTNLAFFAAHLHSRQQKEAPQAFEVPQPASSKKQKTPLEQDVEKNYKNYGITSVADKGGLENTDALFEQGRTDTVAFSFKNGAVWGTLDTQGAPADPQKLQEAVDKLPKEKHER